MYIIYCISKSNIVNVYVVTKYTNISYYFCHLLVPLIVTLVPPALLPRLGVTDITVASGKQRSSKL